MIDGHIEEGLVQFRRLEAHHLLEHLQSLLPLVELRQGSPLWYA
jgi:hypothetical protein